jgi:parvulin-like peptidyl-prolyl isomerase
MPNLLLLLALAVLVPLQDPAEPPEPGDTASRSVAPLASALVAPLYLDAEPPPLRSLRIIHLVHAGVPDVERGVTRTQAETLELAQHLALLVRSGESFATLAAEYSSAKNADTGGVLGSFPPGLLAQAMDAFLYSAEVGEVSEPIALENGVHLLQRIDTYAATRHILLRGVTAENREAAAALKARALEGEDFGELARAHSDDAHSAARGGLYTVFERGPMDRLLKEAAFSVAVGEIAGPIESPVGYHLIQRVPLEGHPPELFEVSQVRLWAILVSHDNTPLGGISANRSMQAAKELAAEIHGRVQAGEDMQVLARELNDDFGGRTRAGDLGWVHRGNPRMAPFLKQAFQALPGELLEPVACEAGWVVVRRVF